MNSGMKVNVRTGAGNVMLRCGCFDPGEPCDTCNLSLVFPGCVR